MRANPSLIRNARLAILWDAAAGRHVYREGVDLALADGRIAAIGPAGSLPVEAGAEAIDATGRMVAPGLVDIHSHPTTEPFYRGVREDHGVPEQAMTGLYERLQAFAVDPESRRAGQTLAYAEILQGGVTTLCDLSAPFDGWVDVMRASGLRVYAAPAFASARWTMTAAQTVGFAWDEKAGEKAFEAASRLMDAMEADPSGLLKGVVYPAQIDTCTEDLLRAAIDLAARTGRLITTHAAQTVMEFREMVSRHGVTPIQWCQSIGLLRPGALIGHAIFVDEHPEIRWGSRRDIAILAETGATVAHCPSPFARYGRALTDVGRYREAGVSVGLGTDCAPHDMAEEMRVAILAARFASQDIRTLDAGSAFHLATVGGADALGRPDLGRIAPGAAADLVLVDLDHPRMVPARDPLRSWIFHGGDRVVSTVLVGGRVVVEKGRALGLDVEAARERIVSGQQAMLAGATARDYRGRHGDAITPLSLPFG